MDVRPATAEALPIEGVSLRPLRSLPDDRGELTELLRVSWLGDGPPPRQWNYVRSRENVLRGVHVHVTHWDFLVVLEGEAWIGLVDLRRGSKSYRNARIVKMRGDAKALLTVRPGVAHGFYFPRASAYTYGLSHYWDPEHDEFGCRWDDAALGLDWGITGPPLLSPRDQSAGSLDDMLRALEGKANWCGSG